MNTVSIPDGQIKLGGELHVPPDAKGIVLFAHGSGSSRFSPRNAYVANALQQQNIGTLLFDLLTPEEDQDYSARFDIALLARRLVAATNWLRKETTLQLGYFGASTGAAAALLAAANMNDDIAAIVSRGGRPDLAGELALSRVKSPTLLIVGSLDDTVIELNREAYAQLNCEKQMILIPSATHLFEEPGTLQQASKNAAAWFSSHFNADSGQGEA